MAAGSFYYEPNNDFRFHYDSNPDNRNVWRVTLTLVEDHSIKKDYYPGSDPGEDVIKTTYADDFFSRIPLEAIVKIFEPKIQNGDNLNLSTVLLVNYDSVLKIVHRKGAEKRIGKKEKNRTT